MAEGKKTGWPKVGSIRRSKDGKNYMKVEPNVTMFVDGVPVEFNEHRIIQLQDPLEKIDTLEKNGYLDAATATERRTQLAAMDWLRYECVVPPRKST